MIELSGRTAVITGGARGIGLALAKRLSGARPDTRSGDQVLRRCGNDGPGDIGRSLLYLYARIRLGHRSPARQAMVSGANTSTTMPEDV